MASQKTTENKQEGFIKVFRSIKTNWLWQDEKKLKWWLDILLTVNHTPKKVTIGFDVIECNRGQTVKSILSWAKDWKVDKSTVMRFFKMLEREDMIRTENVLKTHRLTVCEYESYNGDATPKQLQSNSQATDEQLSSNTNKNVKKDKNDNTKNDIDRGGEENSPATQSRDLLLKQEQFKKRQEKFYQQLVPFVITYGKPMIRAFYDYWSEPTPSGIKMKKELQSTWDLKKRLDRWQKNEDKFSPNKPKATGTDGITSATNELKQLHNGH